MKLVIITNEYPYGKQESFLEEEIRILEKYFDQIHICTLATDTANKRYVPENVAITFLKDYFPPPMICWLSVLTPKSIGELRFSRKAFGYKNLCRSISLLANCFNPVGYALRKLFVHESTEDTVFYSYWWAHHAYGLARLSQKSKEIFSVSRAHRFDNFVDIGTLFYRREVMQELHTVYPISRAGQKEITEVIVPHTQACPRVKCMHLGVAVPEDRARIEKKSDELVICSCSFVVPIKRLDILIDALSRIDDIKIHWIHFGGGPLEAEMKECARQMFSEKANIQYDFRGLTPHDDVLAFYQSNPVDLFVNMSDHEGIPVSIMEAMAQGIPAIARCVGGNGEIIVHESNGYLLPATAGASEYMQAIHQHATKTDEEVNTMRDRAHDYIDLEFNSGKVYDAFAQDVIKMYQEWKNNGKEKEYSQLFNQQGRKHL